MKVEVKKIDATRRELKLDVPKEKVDQIFDEVYVEIGKVANVKGFRQGKAPRQVLEVHHASLAKEEMLKKLIPEAYQEAIAKESLSPIDVPEIHDIAFKDGGVSFTAKLDIKPEVRLKDYKKIKVKRQTSQISDEELNKTLEFFKKGQGAEKEIIVDDNFARGLGYPSLDELKQSLRRQMEIDKDKHSRFDVENQIVEYLIKTTDLKIPESAVNKQLEHLVHETKHRLEHQGLKKEDIDKQEEEMRKELKKSAERDIRIFFIFDKIAELEKITLEKNENIYHKIMGFLLKEAQWEEAKTDGK